MGILIRNAQVILPEGEKDVIKNTNIYVDGKYIAAIGGEEARPDGFTEDEVIDGTDRLVIPGLVNAHTHSYMSFMRNVADDLSFMDWLFGTIDPIEQKMTDEDAYWGAKLAILEMMKSGTTCFNDMQMNIHQTTRAVRESGMRAVISRGLVGSGNDEGGQMRLSQALEERDAARDCDRLGFFLGPHAPYTCDEEYLKIVAQKAKEEHMGIHIHLAESVTEMENCEKQYGCSPIALAERAGIFDVPAIAAHCVQISETDMDILKRKNVSVVTNPASNMKLGNGFAPVPQMLAKELNVCLGTDGAASNNTLNLFHEMSLLVLIHKGVAKDAQCISARECFRVATINGAKALGLAEQTGSLEKGKKADLAILNLRNPSLQPNNNLIAGLCYSANGSEVETVIIDGVITMRDRRVLTMDEDEIYDKIGQIIKRMGLDKKEY